MEYCEKFSISTKQYTQDNLCNFLTWLDIITPGGIKESTAKNKLYAIRECAYQEYNQQINVDNEHNHMLARHRRGIQILNPATQGSKPITMRMCKDMIRAVRQQKIPEWEKQTQQTMFAIAFGETKRAGEYLMDAVNNRQFNHGDLEPMMEVETGEIYYCWTRIKGKTHREGTRRNPLESAVICKCKKWGAILCPKHNIEKLTTAKIAAGIQVTANSPVFLYTNKKQIKPYNKYKAGALLQRMAKAAGYKTKDEKGDNIYSLHGFRKGGAIQGIIDGVPVSTIMKQADWKTERMVYYYNRQKDIDQHAINMMQAYQA